MQARTKDKKQKAERKNALRAALAGKGFLSFVVEQLMHESLAIQFLYILGEWLKVQSAVQTAQPQPLKRRAH